MLLAGFHAGARERPELLVEVNLGPSGANGLGGPGGRQDCEFQSAGANTLLARQHLYEARNGIVGQRRMVLDCPDPRLGREEHVEVAAP
jgi:hypothetical protein